MLKGRLPRFVRDMQPFGSMVVWEKEKCFLSVSLLKQMNSYLLYVYSVKSLSLLQYEVYSVCKELKVKRNLDVLVKTGLNVAKK